MCLVAFGVNANIYLCDLHAYSSLYTILGFVENMHDGVIPSKLLDISGLTSKFRRNTYVGFYIHILLNVS